MIPRISPDRLLDDLEALAAIGGRPDGGVDRVAGSDADHAGRRWLVNRLGEAGLHGFMDGAGNVFGRVTGSTRPFLLLGSHTDTVPAGGRLDGAYGVVAALEVARTLVEAGHPAAARVEVVSFADEEGVGAGGGVAGSTAYCADLDDGELLGFVELHIEQGPRLEALGKELGVVEGIVGIDRWDVVIEGAANHAGTTPLAMRRDAGVAAGRVLAGMPELLERVDPEMVGNVGGLELLPGAANVVPGEARFTVELRALDPASLAAAAAALEDLVARSAAAQGCAHRLRQRSGIPPAPMAPRMVEAIEQVCLRLRLGHARLVSGAGHDAGVLSRRVPTGMIFVPSRGGVSHSPAEFTESNQLVVGAEVLLGLTLDLVGIPKP